MSMHSEVGVKRRRGSDSHSSGGEDASSGDESYASDESDEIEFVLGPKPQRLEPAVKIQKKEDLPGTVKPGIEVESSKESTTKTSEVAATEAAATIAKSEGESSDVQKRDLKDEQRAETAVQQQSKGTLDIDAIGTLDGQPIVQFPPSSFADKPWRRPGADLSDYFNYGLDEFTWMAYCNRQDKLRAHFTPPQVMQMGMPQFMPMGMPPMGMPPMPGMPQMPPMPGMPNMGTQFPLQPTNFGGQR